MSSPGAAFGIRAFRAYVRRASLRRVNNKHVVPQGRWTVVRGDTVVVRAGRDRGRSGVVLKVLRAKNRVVVDGLNVRRRVFRAPGGGAPTLKPVPSPIFVGRVGLADPATGKATRVAVRFTETGARVRVAKRSGTVIPWPEGMRLNRSFKPATPGPKDTPGDVVARVTYAPPPRIAALLSRGPGGIHAHVRPREREAGAGAAAAGAAAERGGAAARGGRGGRRGLPPPPDPRVPPVLRQVSLRRKDRNRLKAKWQRANTEYEFARRVAAALDAHEGVRAARAAVAAARAAAAAARAAAAAAPATVPPAGALGAPPAAAAGGGEAQMR